MTDDLTRTDVLDWMAAQGWAFVEFADGKPSKAKYEHETPTVDRLNDYSLHALISTLAILYGTDYPTLRSKVLAYEHLGRDPGHGDHTQRPASRDSLSSRTVTK